jgi:DMSO reductase family type II enzyme heme b subunit
VQFKGGASVPVAFAVWDGQNVERDGMKGISTWFSLQIP